MSRRRVRYCLRGTSVILPLEAADKPIAIIMDNIKGRGVKAVEETAANHSMTVNAETWDSYIAQVKADLEELKKEGAQA